MKKYYTLIAALILFAAGSFAQEITPPTLSGRWICSDREIIDPYGVADAFGITEDEIYTARIGAWLIINDNSTFSALEYDPETQEEYEINGKYNLTGNKFTAYDIDRPDYRGWDYTITDFSSNEMTLVADILGMFQCAITYSRDMSGTVGITSDNDEEIELYDLSGRLIFTGATTNASPRSGIYILKSSRGTKKIRL